MGGMSALIPFLPLFIRELGVTGTDQIAIWSGLVYGSPFVTFFIAQPLWGVVGDKSGRKLMAVRALGGLAIAGIDIFCPECLLVARHQASTGNAQRIQCGGNVADDIHRSQGEKRLLDQFASICE